MELVMLTPTTDGQPFRLPLFLERVPCGFPLPPRTMWRRSLI